MEFKEQQQTVVRKEEQIEKLKSEIQENEKIKADEEMIYEDHWCQICWKTEKVDSLTFKTES